MSRVILDGFNDYEEAVAFAEWFGNTSPKFKLIDGNTVYLDVLYHNELPEQQEVTVEVNVYGSDSYSDFEDSLTNEDY